MRPATPATDRPHRSGSPAGGWRGYAIALVAFGLAFALRLALAEVLPPAGFPFLTFFPAVLLTAFFGGLGPGLLASALSVLTAWHVFLPPAWSFQLKGAADAIALGFFGVILLVDCIVIHLMTRSLARVREERARSDGLAAELALRLTELRAAHAEGEAVRRRLAASEARLQALNADLQARVAVEVAAREAAQARAAHAERLQALGQLAGGIAHDFNNVLQAIGSSAGLMERRAGDPEAVRRLARLALEATGRGAAVTNRLLAFARRGALRAEPVAPAALLDGLREMLAHTLGAAIAVRVQAPPGLPPLLADRAQLETVLVNLATNARDAMPEGGRLDLAACTDQAAAGHPAGLAPGHYLRLTVRDTGTGMPPEVLARIAEPFFTTKGIGQGTGLGLAMARGFVEQSGGALLVESEEGAGTTVSVWLPQAAGGDGAAATAPPPEGVLRGRRILLVDDEAPVRQALGHALRDLGCRVAEARDAAEALARLRDEPGFDALVTDLSMPGANGLALIREARRHDPALPALLLTGFAGDLGTAGDAPDYVLLRKPVTGGELAAALATLPVRVPAGPG
ncbi:ATP-binding protein [Paracraurococcus ruber]|nr:ATP-binding protein [Paracraurococcus ruber]